MSLFLLGPSRSAAGDGAPLDLRRRLARLMRAHDTRVFVMEDEPDVEGENHFAKFRRLIGDAEEVTFIIVVPVAARLHGTSVEIGHILTLLQEGRLPAGHVHLFLEGPMAQVDAQLDVVAEPRRGRRYGYLANRPRLTQHAGAGAHEEQQERRGDDEVRPAGVEDPDGHSGRDHGDALEGVVATATQKTC